MDQDKLQLLLDRMEIIDTINRYATSVDTRDWDLFFTCYADKINVDMVSVGFEKPMDMTAGEFMEIIQTAVSPFESTQHIISNHVININGDNATLGCYLQAQHFRQDDTGLFALLIGGYYAHSLIRTPAVWRINKYKVVKTWSTTTT